MKLVISTDCFLPRWDGIARYLSQLLPEFARDMEITVFAPKFEGRVPSFKGVNVVRFPLINIQFGDIFFCSPDKRSMESAIAASDIVFNQTIGPVGAAAIKIASKLGKPIVSYIHSIDWELARRAVKFNKNLAALYVKMRARRLYNKCTLLLCPSNEVADLLSQNKVKTRREIVHLGVPTEKFCPPASKSAAKRSLGIDPGFKIVGFCGRIAREKDLPTLHEAFLKVHAKHRDTVLLIVGEGLEREIPASHTVLRVGRQDNVVPFLQAMDIFVLPSLTETSSLATMEAMAVELPVIVTPVGSIREYVVDKKNGLLFDRQDVTGLAEKIEFLLKNPKMRVALGKAARKTIVCDYSWEQTVQKIRKVLTSSDLPR
ncbi:MAG: glycosyltransferase family 4 protein [Candidatus Woesearchaeota archaeon]